MVIVVKIPDAREPAGERTRRLVEASRFLKEYIEGGLCHLPNLKAEPRPWPARPVRQQRACRLGQLALSTCYDVSI
jgi:hypothetical protein